MNATTDSPDPPRRKPGGGRKSGLYEPVTVVSISMHPEQLRAIDREALQSNRSRSAFVRWILRDACHALQSRREDAVPPDPTHGGKFNPDLIGGEPWGCPTPGCVAHDPAGLHCSIVSGWLECHQCGAPRPKEA